jgi:hypothetical protein
MKAHDVISEALPSEIYIAVDQSFCTQYYLNTNPFVHVYLMNLFDPLNKHYLFHFNQEKHQIKRLKLKYNGLENDSSLLTQHASALGSSTGLEQGMSICQIVQSKLRLCRLYDFL